VIQRIKDNMKDQEGSSAVEFALVLLILVVLLFGIIEFGIILYDKAVVTNASREGARFAAVYREPGDEITDSEINSVVQDFTADQLITFGAAAAAQTECDPEDCTPGTGNALTVRVRFRYDYLLLPNLPTGLTGPLWLVGETTMVKE